MYHRPLLNWYKKFRACFRRPTSEQRFWNWFLHNERHLFETDRASGLLRLQKRLHHVNKGLTFEIGEALKNGKKRLYLSADGIRELFPVVAKLVEAAPELNYWELHTLRAAKEGPFIVEVNSLVLDARKVSIDYKLKNGRLFLDIFLEREVLNHPSLSMALYLLLDAILGEYDAATKVQGIELYEREGVAESEFSLKLSMLGQIVEELKEGYLMGAVAVMPPLEKTQLLREPYEVEEQYAFLEGKSGEEERQVVINVGFYYFQLKAEFPWRLCIETQLPYDPIQALSGYDWEAWNTYEQQIEDQLQQCCKAYYVFRSISGNQRKTHFHVNRYAPALKCMQDLQQRSSMFSFTVDFFYERDWETARSLLQHFVKNP